MNQFAGGNGAVVRAEDNGANFGDPTFITFPPIGSSGVAHPHQTIQFKDELFVPDLVRTKYPLTYLKFPTVSVFRGVTPFGGSLPTKTESSRSEERSRSLLGAALVML